MTVADGKQFVPACAEQETLCNEELGAILRAFPEPMFIYDAQGRYLDVLGGVDGEHYHNGRHLIGKRMRDVMPPARAREFEAQITRALTENRPIRYLYKLSAVEVKGCSKNTGPQGDIYFEAHISPIGLTSEPSRKVLWLAFNVTDFIREVHVKEAEAKKLGDQARHDPLTKLINRRGFFQSTKPKFRRREQPLAVIALIDLDNFKQLNDIHGHQAGDAALCAVAERLAAEVRPGDLIARFGGEEFLLWLDNCCFNKALAICERLRNVISVEPVVFDNQSIDISASFGVAQILAKDPEIVDALRRADAALYEAKAAGRNCVRSS